MNQEFFLQLCKEWGIPGLALFFVSLLIINYTRIKPNVLALWQDIRSVLQKLTSFLCIFRKKENREKGDALWEECSQEPTLMSLASEEEEEYGSTDPVTEGVKALESLDSLMRKACIAEACGFVTMPDGSCPYAGKEDHVKYAGVEYTYRKLKRGALLKVGKYETLSAPKLLELRNQNKGIHENWVRAQYYLQICKSEILEHFKKELKDIQG